MSRERIEKDLKEHLLKYPTDASYFLAVIAAGLSDYERMVKQKRDRLATTAIGTLMICKRPKCMKEMLGLMIDPAMYQFPNGPDGHSKVELRFWDEFIELASKDVDHDWLLETRGAAAIEWWDRVVTPYLRK